MNNQQLIIFTRYPEPGTTKTRLIPVLGAKGAANLQFQMTETTITKAKKLSNMMSLLVEVRFAGGNLQLMKNWLGAEPDLKYQEPYFCSVHSDLPLIMCVFTLYV